MNSAFAAPGAPGRTALDNFATASGASSPDLSIVIIPLIGREVLADCLDRLPLDNVECIVVLRASMGTASDWADRYRSVKFIDTKNETVPLRRQCGVKIATADVVGLIEDTSWPDASWCAAAKAAFEDPQTAAAGGPVRIAATLPSRYQALGWSEYGAFAPLPLSRFEGGSAGQRSAVGRVPGNNMAFRRTELIEAMRGHEDGLFEGPVCERLLARGRRVVFQPQMSVAYSARDRHGAALWTRLHHGRLYAASHTRCQTWVGKLAHLAKTPLLPFVLTARKVSYVAQSGSPFAKLPVLFWIWLMESFWSLGEAAGVVTGAGKSMGEWR